MKNIFLIVLLILIFCTGCATTSKLNTNDYIELNEYINIIGDKCIEYINNDNSISLREKNVYKTRHRLIKELIENIKVNDCN